MYKKVVSIIFLVLYVLSIVAIVKINAYFMLKLGLIIAISIIIYEIYTLVLSLDIKIASNKLGYIGNKKIKYNDVPLNRDIPLTKNIWYDNALIKINNFEQEKGNVIGAIILKWIDEGKVSLIEETRKSFTLELYSNTILDDDYERFLYQKIYDYSNLGKINNKELKKFYKKNYITLSVLMEEIVNNQIDELYHNNYIRDRNNSKECHKKYVMEDKIYFDSIKLLGLKKFLNEFSPDDKEIKDVHMWNNYLIYAYLFGMEKIIQKKFKTSRIDNISYKLAFSSDLLYVTDKLFFALMDIVVILSRPIGIISYRSFDNQ